MNLGKVKRLHTIQSARVKCLDYHPTQPLLLASLYSGDAIIIDCITGTITKSLPVHPGLPLRTGRWIPQNGNAVFGGDKYSICFFSTTQNKLLLEIPDAHNGYIRSLAVHPTEMLLLSCSDDLTCKLWDISSGCTLVRTFDMHSELVMDVKWNPKDPTTFASCSLDGSVIFWDLSSEQPRFTQKLSTRCINSISFAFAGDRPLIAAASDDHLVHILDLQTRSISAKLEAHENNVTRVEFHPTRPIIISTGEDFVSFIWSAFTFKKINSVNAGLERGWAAAITDYSPYLAIGYDRGVMVLKFVQSEVVMSLNCANDGKIVVARGSELSVAGFKGIDDIVDGSEINLAFKEAITTELPVSELHYSPNGRYIATVGEGEYTIYTSLGYRSRSYGKCLKFAWAPDSEKYAILELNRSVSVISHFENSQTIQVFAKKIWGGELLSASVNNGIEFYDWDTTKLIRRIESKASEVKWYDDMVAVRTKDSIYILQYNHESESEWTEDAGYEDSFNVIHEIDTKSTSIFWVNGVLLFTENSKINRYIGGVVQTTATLKVPSDILGYLSRQNLIILVDQKRKIIGVYLPMSLLQFEAAVAEDEDADPEDVPEQYKSKCAKYLKQLGKNELALQMATDDNLKFDLAIELGHLDIAKESARDASMWRRLARAALISNNTDLAIDSLKNCGDLSTLLMLLKAKNRVNEMQQLVIEAENAGQFNVAFTACLLTNQKRKCVEILIKSEKYAEAALFARSNVPEMISETVKLWKQQIPNKKLADALADPEEYPNLFDEMINNEE